MAYNNINSQNIYNNNNQNLNKGIYSSHSMDDYEKLGEIGAGQFSTVYKVRYKKTGDIFAMKKIKKRPPNETEEQKKQIRREIENLEKCYHWENNYNTVKLFNHFVHKNKYILIFSYCDTDLEKYVKEHYPNKIMPLEDIKKLFLELNNGFKNLYLENVIHRDIKINNILIEYRLGDKTDIIPRLADFGISRENSSLNMTKSVSYLLLSAPEVLYNGTDYSFASDLWSIGVLLYLLAFGKYPYEDNGPAELYEKIMSGKKKLQKTGDKKFDDLISKLLKKDKDMRIKYKDYFNHPFFQYDEPKSIINLREKYNIEISSYNREFRTTGIAGNILLKELSNTFFVNLRELNLQACNISDLNPLSSEVFKNLIFLNLQYNKIYDLEPLKNIKFLRIKQMYFGFNKIMSIEPLFEIPFQQLQMIGIGGNHIIWDEETKYKFNNLFKN